MRTEAELQAEVRRVMLILSDALEAADTSPATLCDTVTNVFTIYARSAGLTLDAAIEEIRYAWNREH